MYFCLSSFCSCWEFVLSLIYASVGYGLSTVGCSFPLTRRVEDYFWGIFGLLLPFSLGASVQCPRHLFGEQGNKHKWKKTVIHGICIHHSFRCGFHLLEDGP
jgi:hypothetical protein